MARAREIRQLTYGEDAVAWYDYYGTHEEDKPTAGVATGSFFTEVDTGDVYAYDESAETWHKIAELGGGS